jgi:oxygen-independent coproporphyrinogen III oxidase
VQGLYVHVPFCFHKCHYCDFYSITQQSPQRMEQFVDLVLAEAAFWSHRSAAPILRPRTIFFGGGTPSLLPAGAMRRLILGLRDRLDLSRVREWTIEVNPATAELGYCQMLRELGVDRLSFGAQSFRPGELQLLERHHDPEDVPRSVEIARNAGFSRINVDLIYAIPGQDLESWSQSLQAALALGTSHISGYNLTYEPNTPMAVKKRLGRIIPVEEDVELQMLHHARKTLCEAGLPPYEISNYARAGEECQHNLVYWTGGNYIGLGPSAASHVEGHRWRNRPHLGQWEDAISNGILPAQDVEELSPPRRAGELAMLMLRLSRGINFDEFAAKTGHDAREIFADQIKRFAPTGLIEVGPDAIRLAERGVNVADALAAEFLV